MAAYYFSFLFLKTQTLTVSLFSHYFFLLLFILFFFSSLLLLRFFCSLKITYFFNKINSLSYFDILFIALHCGFVIEKYFQFLLFFFVLPFCLFISLSFSPVFGSSFVCHFHFMWNVALWKYFGKRGKKN